MKPQVMLTLTRTALRRSFALLILISLCAAPAALAQPQGPTATPTPPDPFVVTQTAALLPATLGDLAGAKAWDRYTIIAALSPGERRVRGTVTVAVTNRASRPYERLYFHLYPNHPDFGGRLDVTGARLDGQPVVSGTEQGDTLFWLALPRPLPPGGTVRAELSFVARTPRNGSGATFGAFNQEAGLWSLANFYPILARYFADTGWDRRPIDSQGDFVVSSTALYEVTIDVPTDWTLISTGARVSATAVTDSVRRERFVSGPQREFYLGATQGRAQVSTTVDGTRIVSHYQTNHTTAGRKALRVAEQALRVFNARYGAYPLAELDVVESALTNFYGMEYPGVVLIEQTLYAANAGDFEVTVAHEIAHQWWYSQVGNDAQGEAWLDEGFASYSQVLYYEGIAAPALATDELNFFREEFSASRRRGRDAPLATPPSGLDGMYVPVVYDKGALFFHSLRGQIGEAAFSRFLKGYYSEGRYRDVAGPDLLRAAETACACQLTQLYRDWVLTKAPVRLP